jgi:hypothetical protein
VGEKVIVFLFFDFYLFPSTHSFLIGLAGKKEKRQRTDEEVRGMIKFMYLCELA